MMKAAAVAKEAEAREKSKKRPPSGPPDTPSSRPSKQVHLSEPATEGPAAAVPPPPAPVNDKGKAALFVPNWRVTVKDSFATDSKVVVEVMRELSKLDPGFSEHSASDHLLGIVENQARSLRSAYDLILKQGIREDEETKLRARVKEAEARAAASEKKAAEDMVALEARLKKAAEEMAALEARLKKVVVVLEAKLKAEAELRAQVTSDLEGRLQRMEMERVKAGEEAIAAYKFTYKFFADAAPLVGHYSWEAYNESLEHVKLRYPEVVVEGLYANCSKPEVVPGPGDARCKLDVSIPELEATGLPAGEGEGEWTSPDAPEESAAPSRSEV